MFQTEKVDIIIATLQIKKLRLKKINDTLNFHR